MQNVTNPSKLDRNEISRLKIAEVPSQDRDNLTNDVNTLSALASEMGLGVESKATECIKTFANL